MIESILARGGLDGGVVRSLFSAMTEESKEQGSNRQKVWKIKLDR